MEDRLQDAAYSAVSDEQDSVAVRQQRPLLQLTLMIWIQLWSDIFCPKPKFQRLENVLRLNG